MKAALFLLGLSLLGGAHLCGQSGLSIPITHAVSLADTTVNLPDDLKGRPAVLVLGFSKSSSRQIKPWADAIERDFPADSKIALYQLPMLQELPHLLRGLVLQGMRKPLSPTERAHFVPVFDNEAAWKMVTHFAGPDDAYVLLVDSLGHIQWQFTGVFGKEKYEELRSRAIAME